MKLEERLRRALPRPLFSGARLLYNQRPHARAERRGWARRRQVAEAVTANLGSTVRAGPFSGMSLPTITWDAPAKLLGSYEQELHPVINDLIAREYTTIVNVGCAEGYYAVGMAMRNPGASVVAYDIERNQQELCKATAAANGCAARVEIRGECTATALASLDEQSLVIMDCEGCEDALLVAPMRAAVLVELHDFEDNMLPDRIIERFGQGHDVQVICSSSRDACRYPELSFLSAEDQALAVFERATPQRWALIRPRLDPKLG